MRNDVIENTGVLANLHELMYFIKENYRERVAVIETSSGTEHTYEEVYTDVAALTVSLKNMKLHGKNTIIIGENSYNFFICYLAVACCGGIAIPLSWEMNETDLIKYATKLNGELLFYPEYLADKVKNWTAKVPAMKKIIGFSAEYTSELNSLIDEGRRCIENGDNYFGNICIPSEQLSTIFLSSGTTGANKAVMISHKNTCYAIYHSTYKMGLKPDRSLVVLPMYHIFGLCVDSIATLYFGDTLCICDRIQNFYDDIKRYKPSRMMIVPAFGENIIKRVKNIAKEMGLINNPDFDIASIKDDSGKFVALLDEIEEQLGINMESFNLLIAGAPSKLSTFQNLTELGVDVITAYGLTETTGVAISVNKNVQNDPHSVGKIFPLVDAKIVSPDSNGVGELLLKGECITRGYYKDSEATENSFTPDGWFCTGDYACIDENNKLTIYGRKKNTIILANGENVCPEEIEALVLGELPYVDEVVACEMQVKVENIIGLALNIPGEIESETVMNDLRKVNKVLASSKRVGCFCITDTPFEKTATKKIIRAAVNVRVSALDKFAL